MKKKCRSAQGADEKEAKSPEVDGSLPQAVQQTEGPSSEVEKLGPMTTSKSGHCIDLALQIVLAQRLAWSRRQNRLEFHARL